MVSKPIPIYTCLSLWSPAVQTGSLLSIEILPNPCMGVPVIVVFVISHKVSLANQHVITVFLCALSAGPQPHDRPSELTLVPAPLCPGLEVVGRRLHAGVRRTALESGPCQSWSKRVKGVMPACLPWLSSVETSSMTYFPSASAERHVIREPLSTQSHRERRVT